MKNARTGALDVRAILARLAHAPDAAPDTAPDAVWRARLREQFIADTIPVRRAPTRLRAAAPAAIAALAAAAAFVVFALLPAGPEWRLLASAGDGALTIDGRRMLVSDTTAIAAALHAGADLELPPQAQLEVVLPGAVLMQIPGGTHASIPSRPGRWFHRELNASLDRGEVRFTTGSTFHGARLTIATREARAVVTGTTLAVLRASDSTCVCVFDGSVVVHTAATVDTVHAGTRRSMFATGLPAHVEPIRAMETMKLSMLHKRAAAVLRH